MKKEVNKKVMEIDLYGPIYNYLISQGYIVHSEVKNCDITAIKGEELVVIEMKLRFNATLLMQAVQRQKAADSVYVAILKPKGGAFSKGWDDMCHLLKRLELGLITVSFNGKKPMMEIVFHPMEYKRKKNNNIRKAIIREINGRYIDYNIGGSTRRKLMTAYRENSIHIACCLEKFGQLSPKQLKELGTGEKTQSILSKNFYGWFHRVSVGKYELQECAKEALKNYHELAEHYRKQIKNIDISKFNSKA